jgi:hypothetical protein
MCDLVTGGNGSVAVDGVPTSRSSFSSSIMAGMVGSVEAKVVEDDFSRIVGEQQKLK